MMPMDWSQVSWLWGMGMLAGMGVFFVVWALILAALVLLVRWLWVQGRSASRSEEAPLEILKRRYARGEISREDFESMRRDLLA